MSSPARKALFTALAPSPNLSQIVISVPGYTASTITVSFSLLPAASPATDNNFVAVWESTMIPWRATPIATATITKDQQMGSVIVPGLKVQQKAYIVGYAAGKVVTDICATAVIYVGGQSGNTFSTSIGLSSVTDDTLVVSYQTCPGYNPAAAKNWIGLWQGAVSPYYAGTPIATAQVTSTSNQDDVPMSNLGLSIRTLYTLVYFMGPTNDEAAAIVTFTTAG